MLTVCVAAFHSLIALSSYRRCRRCPNRPPPRLRIIQARGDERGERLRGGVPLLDRVSIGDVDVARAVHRHARQCGQGYRVGGHVTAAGLGHGKGLAGDGQRAGPRGARIGVEAELDQRVARPGIAAGGDVQPGGVCRRRPSTAKVTTYESLPAAGPSTSAADARDRRLGHGQGFAGDGQRAGPRGARVGVEAEGRQAVAVAAGGSVQPEALAVAVQAPAMVTMSESLPAAAPSSSAASAR